MASTETSRVHQANMAEIMQLAHSAQRDKDRLRAIAAENGRHQPEAAHTYTLWPAKGVLEATRWVADVAPGTSLTPTEKKRQVTAKEPFIAVQWAIAVWDNDGLALDYRDREMGGTVTGGVSDGELADDVWIFRVPARILGDSVEMTERIGDRIVAQWADGRVVVPDLEHMHYSPS